MPHKMRLSPGWWPLFVGLLPATWCTSYGIAILVTSARLGRQSSTTGIGVFLAFVGAVMLAGAGLLIGRLIARLLPEMPPAARRHRTWLAGIVLVIVAASAFKQASGPMYAAEHEATPRVIVDRLRLRPVMTGQARNLVPASRVMDVLASSNQPIAWGTSRVELVRHPGTLGVTILPQQHSRQIALPGIDYILYVDAIPLEMDSGQPVLALLVTGRATGRRDLLCVIDDSGEVLYLELLDRFWDFRKAPLAITRSASGDRIVVGSDVERLLLFAPEEPG